MAEPVFDGGIIPTGYERTLPPELQLIVRARRRVLLRRAHGRVLDLGGAETHAALWRNVADIDDVTVLRDGGDFQLGELVGRGARFDTVVSVFQLASAPDLEAMVARIAKLVADDGDVLFLEPGRLVGAAGRVQRLVNPSLSLFTGWRIDRNIPVALRQGGLSVVDLERHRVPTVQWWLRQLDEGRAHPSLLEPISPPDR